jgi:hypothetical protein
MLIEGIVTGVILSTLIFIASLLAHDKYIKNNDKIHGDYRAAIDSNSVNMAKAENILLTAARQEIKGFSPKIDEKQIRPQKITVFDIDKPASDNTNNDRKWVIDWAEVEKSKEEQESSTSQIEASQEQESEQS